MRDHSWLLEVLSDVELYARGNDLHDLAEALPAVRNLARREIAAIPPRNSGGFPMKGENFVVIADTGEPSTCPDR